MPSSLLVRTVFGLLVLATAGAFFVTQRLKRSTPVVERIFYPRHISPNGDGRKDTARLRFDLPEPDRVIVSMVGADGGEVRRLAEDEALAPGRHSYTWDGRTDEGGVAPDGSYRLRVTLRSEGRAVTAPRTLSLDTIPPTPRIVAVTPPQIVPGDRASARGRTRIRYAGPSDPAPEVRIYRTDRGPAVEVTCFKAPRFRQTATWDGTLGGRERCLEAPSFREAPVSQAPERRDPAPEGIYAVALTVFDEAGNAGSAPTALPPRRGGTVPRTGVSARYLTLAGPLEPVRAGRVARLAVGPKARRFRWNLARLGAGRPLRRGRGSGLRLAFRLPRDARTGLYLVRVQAGGRRAVAPLAVTGVGGGGPAVSRRPLVVLPAITWQGLNEVDDDRDGFADTLEDSSAARAERPFARGRLPVGLVREAGPLLRFLDRERLVYDLTTDLALARGRRPGIRGRAGVVFAGSERWLTEALDLALRRYVDDGGRVASFGTDAFRRRLGLRRDLLVDPSAPERANVFGEKTTALRIPPAPLAVTADRELGLFTGTDLLVGLFTRFEQSEGLVAGARVLAAAGREPGKPAFVAYRLGRGLVIRAGTPQWSAALTTRPEVARVTRRIWALLSP